LSCVPLSLLSFAAIVFGQSVSEVSLNDPFLPKKTDSGTKRASAFTWVNVVPLSDSNFAPVKDTNAWVIMAGRTTCGFTQRSVKDFEAAATQLKGTVKFGWYDVDANRANLWAGGGLPLFGGYKKGAKKASDRATAKSTGDRNPSQADLVAWAKTFAA